MQAVVEVQARFAVTGDHLPTHLDAVMSELVRLDSGDPGISINNDTGAVDFSLMFAWDPEQLVAALQHALGVFRTAIHAAGGYTPDWPDVADVAAAFDARLQGFELDLVDA